MRVWMVNPFDNLPPEGRSSTATPDVARSKSAHIA